MLVEAGANINDARGVSETKHYISYSILSCQVVLLIRHCVTFSSVQDGTTALMFAAYLGCIESVRVLVEAGADLTLADEVRLV